MDPVSAIGLADNCLSFANALYSYITIVASAKDDIQRVSGELQATSVVLRDLAKLIEKYQHTEAWKGERMVYAQGCIDKAGKNISKMKEMLLKTTTASDSSTIERDDIDINKIQLLVFWPGRRSKLEERRAELASSKTDILLAYTMYTAAALPNTAIGKKAEAEIPGLFRASRRAKQEIRTAKRQKKLRQSSGRQQSGDALPDDLEVLESYEYDVGDDALVYENEDDLRQDFEDWVREKEERKKEAEAKQKKLEDDAVEAWRKSQREQAQQRLREVRAQRSKLQNELEKQRLAPQQIRDTLDHLHPLPRHDNSLDPASVSGDDNALTSIATDTVGREPQSDRPERSFWSKFSSLLSRKPDIGNAHNEIPVVLQDPTRPGGFAEVVILLFEKTFTPHGQNVVQVNCDFEPQWLISTLREMETRHKRFDFDPALKEFAKLPSQYRFAISAATHSYNSNRDPGSKWVLIFVRCLKLRKSRSWFKKSEHRIRGVYVALKKTANTYTDDNPHVSEPTAVELDRDRSASNMRNEYSRPRTRYSSSSDDEGEDFFESRRASRSRSRQTPRPQSRMHPHEDASIAKRASKLSQLRAHDDDDLKGEIASVQRSGFTYPENIVIHDQVPRPRSRERTRPRRQTYNTEDAETDFHRNPVVRRRTTEVEYPPMPIVLAHNQQPYSAQPLPVVHIPREQRWQAQWDPYASHGHHDYRRRGDTYDSINTSQVQAEANGSEYYSKADYFPSRRQTRTDSYKPPKHTRFADVREEIIIRSKPHRPRQPHHRSQTPAAFARIGNAMEQTLDESPPSSSDEETVEIIRTDYSDDTITRQLLSRFRDSDNHNQFRSESAPASFFGGTISEEPGSNSSAAGSQVGDNTVFEEGTARVSRRQNRTIESVD